MPWLINASQVDKFRKNQKSVVILDATYHLANEDKDAKQEYFTKHIVGAQFFDLREFRDTTSSQPNFILLDEQQVSEKLGKLGIKNDSKIILYDNSPMHTSCRALWMLKVWGHHPQQLYILDGGIQAWEKYGGKTDAGEAQITPRSYSAKINSKYLSTLDDIKENLKNPTQQIMDARHPMRFAGAPEARKGLRAGHIPGSYCFPFKILFDKEENFLPIDKIRKKFLEVGVDINTPIITSCGSGTTAPIINFALDILGSENHSVYNGSWTEYGAETLYPGEQSLMERPVEDCISS